VVGRLTLRLDALVGFPPPKSLLDARRLRVVVTHGLKTFQTTVALPEAALGGGGAGAAPSPPQLPLAQLCRAWVRRGEEGYVATVELLTDPFGSPPEPLARAYVPLEHLMDGMPRVVRSALAPTAAAGAAPKKGELGLTDAGLNKLIAQMSEGGLGFSGGGAPPAPGEPAAARAGKGEEDAPQEVEVQPEAEAGGVPAPLGTLVLRAQFEAKSDLESAFCATLAKEFDVDNSGSLDEGELLALLASLGAPAPCIAAEGATAHLYAAMHAPGGNGRLPLEDVARHAWAQLPMAFSLLNFLADGASSSRRLLADFTQGEAPPREMGEAAMAQRATERTRGGAAAAVLRTEGRTVVDELGLVCIERATGLLVQEHIPRRIKTALELMYTSQLGHALTHTAGVRLALKKLSAHEGRVMDAPESKASIAAFVREFAVPLEECAEPLAAYDTFNAFFSRRLRAGARPVAAPGEPRVLVSPADCRLAAFATQGEACDVWVKGEAFSLGALLGPTHAELAAALEGGPILVCRLAPQDYHRFHAPLAGVVEALTPVDGELYTVNPIAVRSPRPDIFTSNKRVVVPFRTEAAGRMAFVAVGATAVGSIYFTAGVGDAVEKGGELGYFSFGGSTVLCIFGKGALDVDKDILSNSRKPLETIVKVGEAIAKCRGAS
jgi:phosphatidylserine decarboxylase precursor